VTVTDRVVLALQRRAYSRIDVITPSDDQRELTVCRQLLLGAPTPIWVTVVVSVLDAAGALPAPTDAQIDAAVLTAWNRIKLTG
jgi:hypothetical protein